MRAAVLSTILIQFFSALSTASAALDDAAPVISEPNLLGGGSVAYHHPVVLADIEQKLQAGCATTSGGDCSASKCCSDGSACTWSGINGSDRYYCTSSGREPSTRERDYCFDASDYGCYTKGVPKCCTSSRYTCPSDKPRCDTSTAIPAGEYCNSSVDTCEKGFACVDWTCQGVSRAAIGEGGVCRVGVDICVRGTICTNGRCTVPPVPAGGICYNGDVCVDGYFCNNGRCDPTSRRVVRRGEACWAGDVCEAGYTCTDGRCFLPALPVGRACSQGDVCASGSACLNGICSARSWYSNLQWCVLDCPISTGACCGGYAQSRDLYTSAEACCNQQASVQGNYNECLNNSLQCAQQGSQGTTKAF